MGIADFFRPKHRHSDIRVRTEAVRALGTDDAAILETIAKTDRDASVRRIAIEKIATPELLADIANSDSEQGLADFAGERAASLWTTVACSDDPEGAGNALSGLLKLGDHRAVADVAARAQVATVRRRALTEIRDPKALADLAKRDVAHEVRLEAVSRIDDSEVLRALAMDTTNKEVGLAAVDKIDDQTLLELIANKGKNKGVRQRARKVLNEMEAAQKLAQGGSIVATATVSDETKRRRAEKAQLLREVETLVEKYDLSKASQLAALETKYEALGSGVGDASDDKFAAIIRKFAMRKQAAEQKVAQARQSQDLENERRQVEAQRAQAAREQQAADARDDVAAVLVDPAEEAKRQARRAEAEARRAQRDAWQAAELARREASDAERALKLKAKREREKEALAQLGELVGQMEDATAGRKVSFDRAESASTTPGAPETEPVDGETAGSDNNVKRRRAKAPAAERLLEQAAKVFADVARVPESERDAIETRYHTVRAALVSQMADKREAEDWARWNNVPQAESLIKVAKEMLDIEVGAAGSPNAGEVAGLLKELQQSWKEVGPLPQKKSKEMWDTFKAACDQVFDKIRGQRAVAAEKYVEVAAAKEKLIAQAEALSESTDWGATADKLKSLQAAWKTSGNLPRAQSDELWNRFRAVCDKFFERRKPVLDARDAQEAANLQRKEALIAHVQALVAKAPHGMERTSGGWGAGSSGGWGKAIGQVKDAQADWKEIGHVPRRDSDRVWNDFRAACDGLFAKRDAERNAESNARRDELAAARSEIDAVMAGGEDIVTRALAARAKVTAMVEDGYGHELLGLLDQMDRHVMRTGGEALKGTALDPIKMKNRRAHLLSSAREYLPKQPTGDTATRDEPQDVAAKLAAAMKKNAFGTLRFSGRDPVEAVTEMRIQFASVGPLLDDEDLRLEAEFSAVCEQIAPGSAPPQMTKPVADAAPARAPVAAMHDAVTTPVDMPGSLQDEPALAAPRARSLSEPPVMDEMDSAWDTDDHRPQQRPDEPSSPGAVELASDGGASGDGDSGWD